MKNKKTWLGIGLGGFVLALFGVILTKSDVAVADITIDHQRFIYTGINNSAETVYGIDFLGKSRMFLTGEDGNFNVSQIPVLLNSSEDGISGGVSNILGGENVNLGNSSNITVIGGNGTVEDENSNVTLFGGKGNMIQGAMSDTPTVLLGGENNIVETDHDANAIVGGSENTIKEGSENVNILGGTSISISGDNVVAAGQKINGNVSDSFVFHDSQGTINVDGSGMFFLNVSYGVGIGTGTKMNYKGVVSNGAVKVGTIDISNVSCLPDAEHVGLVGLWNGCLVGCTSGSAGLMKWEMLDYGDYCAQMCDGYTAGCIQSDAADPVDDYQSFCTVGVISTGNAHMCNTGGVENYNNVVFETYLIDSDDGCPLIGSVDNQCAFQCNEHVHLTGDQTGKRGGVTMCFNDCPLPWSGSQYRKHNEMITGYSVTDVNCSNGTGVNDMTCKSYKSNLRCVDGTWYIANSGGEVTNTENTQYIYESCSLLQYRCDTGVYNLTREDIVNEKYDYVPTVWRYSSLLGNTASLLLDFFNNENIYPGRYFFYNQINWVVDASSQEERPIQNGVRGKYEICIDYDPATPNNEAPQNETLCTETAPLPLQYHYKYKDSDECQSGYDLAPEDSVCRQRCYYQGAVIKHGNRTTLYTGANAHCPDACHEQKFQCYDGTLYSIADLVVENGKFITGTAQSSTIYTYPSCSLTGEICTGFIINTGDYLPNQNIGTFTSCNRYDPSGILACTYVDTMYHLEACDANYYSNSAQTGCNECPNGDGYHYQSDTGSTSVTQCSIRCQLGYHVAQGGSGCQACGIGKYNPQFSGSINMNVLTYAMQYVNCSNCTNKPTVGVYEYTSYGTGINNCPWRCGSGYYLSGTNKCIQCPSGYYTPGGSGATSLSQCRINCTGANHVATGSHQCVACAIGTATGAHSVSGGNKSFCIDCVNGPTNKSINTTGYHYITNGSGGANSCTWQCSKDYYLSGTYPNGKCERCDSGYKTNTGGKTSITACGIDCPAGTHVVTPGGQCQNCPIGETRIGHTVFELNTSDCKACTNKPANSHYTSRGTTENPTNCEWACDTDYYRNAAGTGCTPCDPGYHTEGSGATQLSQCKITCNACNYVATARQQCVPCPAGTNTGSHTFNGGTTGVCISSCTKPANSSRTGNTPTSCCNWICNKDYYLNSAQTSCNACDVGYKTNTGGKTSITACGIDCPAGTHVATPGGQCQNCPIGETRTAHTVFELNTSDCKACTNKPENSHYTSRGTTENPTNCEWACDANYYRNAAGTGCTPCPAGYNTDEIGSGATQLSQCKITCDAGTHVAVANEQCVLCQEGKDSNTHTVNGGSTSTCTISCTKPDNSIYTGNTPENRCNWVCIKDYYRNPAKTGCTKCLVNVGSGYHSITGSTSEGDCKIACDSGTYVATARGACVECGDGTTTSWHTVNQGNSEVGGCNPCGNLPDNAHYNNGGSCLWGCNKDYYRNTAKTGCIACLSNYYTDYQNNIAETACKIQCNAGTYLKNPRNTSCTTCPVGSGSDAHSVQQGNTSICPDCTNKPTQCSEYTGYGIGINKCGWRCSANCYLSGTYTNGTCPYCPDGYTSSEGSTSRSQCKITCPVDTHVASVDGKCTACEPWSERTGHTVNAGNTSDCVCMDLPDNAYYD